MLSLLGRLSDRDQADSLLTSFTRILECRDERQARGDLLTLKTKLDSLLSLQAIREEAMQEVLSLEGATTPVAEEARSFARTVGTSDELRQLKIFVRKALEEERRKQDTQYIEQALREVLTELGYTAGDFAVSDFGNYCYADHDDYPNHGLRVQINQDGTRLFSRMVSYGASTPELDYSAEKNTCGDVLRMGELLSERGIDSQIILERLPGERLLDIVNRDAVTAAAPMRFVGQDAREWVQNAGI